MANSTNCPACGLRCVYWPNWDVAECPEHGEINGMTMMRLQGADPIDALIEIRSSQNMAWAYNRFRDLERWIYNDSYLKIRAPHFP